MTLTLLLLAACAVEDTNPDGAAPVVDDFENTLTELEAKTTEHYHAVVGKADTDAIAEEESAFWDLCQGLWDDASTCWDRMEECGMGHGMDGMMGGDDDDDWDTWMHDMRDAMKDHHDAMQHCADAADCHDTETGWHDAMTEMFDHMHGMTADWPEDCDW
jgi:hypothetical protein